MTSPIITQIENFNSACKTILTTIAIFLTGYIQTSFTIGQINNKALLLVISGVVLLSFVEVGARLIEYFINKSAFIRKVILRDNFFEGLWIDATEVNTFAIITIRYEKNRYFLHGKSYSQNGELLGRWDSVCT